MSRMLERERTPVSVRRRSPILDYPLIVLGAVAALVHVWSLEDNPDRLRQLGLA